jgi:hypothetical protein
LLSRLKVLAQMDGNFKGNLLITFRFFLYRCSNFWCGILKRWICFKLKKIGSKKFVKYSMSLIFPLSLSPFLIFFFCSIICMIMTLSPSFHSIEIVTRIWFFTNCSVPRNEKSVLILIILLNLDLHSESMIRFKHRWKEI